MNISLYVSRSDDYTQIEHVLKQLGISYTLYLKDEDPKIEPWLAVPSLSVVVINDCCTFFEPNINSQRGWYGK